MLLLDTIESLYLEWGATIVVFAYCPHIAVARIAAERLMYM